MIFELWLAFVVASIVMLAIPGPTILTVISYSMTYGRQANVPLVAAVALGDTTALALSLLGLGALLTVSATWFLIIKWVGGLYLLYMGVKLIRAGVSPVECKIPEAPSSMWSLFLNTWFVTALNPKGIVFFVAFLPQFMDPNKAIGPQLWVLSITFVFLAVLNTFVYTIFAGRVRRLLTSSRVRKRFNLAGGSLLSIAGFWALTAKHST